MVNLGSNAPFRSDAAGSGSRYPCGWCFAVLDPRDGHPRDRFVHCLGCNLVFHAACCPNGLCRACSGGLEPTAQSAPAHLDDHRRVGLGRSVVFRSSFDRPFGLSVGTLVIDGRDLDVRVRLRNNRDQSVKLSAPTTPSWIVAWFADASDSAPAFVAPIIQLRPGEEIVVRIRIRRVRPTGMIGHVHPAPNTTLHVECSQRSPTLIWMIAILTLVVMRHLVLVANFLGGSEPPPILASAFSGGLIIAFCYFVAPGPVHVILSRWNRGPADGGEIFGRPSLNDQDDSLWSRVLTRTLLAAILAIVGSLGTAIALVIFKFLSGDSSTVRAVAVWLVYATALTAGCWTWWRDYFDTPSIAARFATCWKALRNEFAARGGRRA